MFEARRYCGTLICALITTYEAFDKLPEHERAFIDAYIVSIGDRLLAQSDARKAKQKQDMK